MAIINIGVSAQKSFIRDRVGYENSLLESDGVRTRWNADDSEFAAHPIVPYAAGISLTGNEMQFPAVVAHDPTPHWHVAIMLPRSFGNPRKIQHSRTIRFMILLRSATPLGEGKSHVFLA